MGAITSQLHEAFLLPLKGCLVGHGSLAEKPLTIDLALPYPPRLRVYMYSLVGGVGEKSRREYKIVLRVRKQKDGEVKSFDYSYGRMVLVVGYRADLDVFVLWDPSLHSKFTAGVNLQVKDVTVHSAAATGRADQLRTLANGAKEIVIACQTSGLLNAIHDRIVWTGEDEPK